MTDYFYRAESWDEFIHDLKTKDVKAPYKKRGDRHSEIGSADWAGSQSFKHSMELAELGCPTTREAIHQASFKVQTDCLPEWDTAPVGVFPCIPAYTAGVPEDMFTQSEWGNPIPKPIVRIVVNVGANANVSAESIINRGGAILALIDRVQLTGQRVELVAEWHTRSHTGDWYVMSVTVKRPEEPADLDRIAYAVAHPSMLRRSLFRVLEFTAPSYVSGYGVSTDYHTRDAKDDVYIKSMSSDGASYRTRSDARAKIDSIWEQAGQPA